MRDEILKLYLPVASSKSTLPLSAEKVNLWWQYAYSGQPRRNTYNLAKDVRDQALRAIELEKECDSWLATWKGADAEREELKRENAELKARMK